MRVLVTGASGYTGARLVARLIAEGHRVRALTRRAERGERLRAIGARVMVGDLTDRASVAGIAATAEVIYHLAGAPLGDAARMRRTLVDGTRTLIDQCLAAGAGADGPLRALIVAGNAAVYGDGHGAILNEDSPIGPAFALGEYALQVEEALGAAGRERGLPSTVLRLGQIYGPGRLSSEALRAGRLRIHGHGRNHSSRIHVDDLVEALLALGRAPSPGRVYCVADMEPCAVAAYHGHLAALLGAAPPSTSPASRARLHGTLTGVCRRWGAPDRSAIGLALADLRLDASRLRAAIGLTLRYPSFREGLPAALAAEREAATARCGRPRRSRSPG